MKKYMVWEKMTSTKYFMLIKSWFLQNGNRYENFYKIDGCENWIEDEIAKLQKNKIEYEIIANDEEQPKALRAQWVSFFRNTYAMTH